SGGFGEVRLGRDYTPTFWNDTVFDPFGTNGVGTNVISSVHNGGALLAGAAGVPAAALTDGNYVRASNTIGYFLPPNLGGFYGQLQYGFHEQTKYDGTVQTALNNNSRGGRYMGGRFGYANGPLDVAVAYGVQTNTSDFLLGTNTDAKNLNVGASYDFGVVKLFGQIGQIKRKVDFTDSINEPSFNPSLKHQGYLLGVTVPVGAGLIRASYGHVKVKVDRDPFLALANPFATTPESPKADQIAIGYVHNLSKRTALYATGTYVKNKNGTAFTAGSGNIDAPFVSPVNALGTYRAKSSMGYDFGIRHAF
ncbi:MAG: porin, partial [Alcaligenaceae bacterium]